ncbi:Uncharacterized membrane protein YkvA, DUF1232 family [Caloramator quimbayensis]|uniref:Uncharacterized membrane protein YkvA, DUF1232 family n=1 Tax=Caloramator quimbayensis TaxID=1147123 RepID=A0A1T4WM82_9CLOT|nr:DUF1232 domain-containing protein [Caloramator quimbayensis]SKA77978.1 Uncharacterized membrane protein YkvA, DUF1232 family [Caloramator quimbayensis]
MKIKQKIEEIKKQTYVLYLACKKKETPVISKIFAIIVVSYALSPIDLIPDFIPVLGYLDDLLIIPLGIIIAMKLIPIEIIKECEIKADEKLKSDIPEAKIAGRIIISLWILIIIFILYKIFSIIRFNPKYN